ncbi:MAG: ribosome maturation factor RimP [Calditrichaeota bacterium]|nr:MAG: ribosome maturation factor RimP [Calditrichota bacterium]
MNDLKKKLFTLVEPVIRNKNIDLVDIEVKGSQRNPVVCVFVDEPGGITINKCTEISRTLQKIFDEKEFLPSGYRIDVSSPGLDRPLKNQGDFNRNIGRFVKIIFTENEQNQELTGVIKKAGQDLAEIEFNNQNKLIPYSSIKKALIQIKWK